MTLFTSARERRRWLWTMATMVAIYSTLGPARDLTDFLRAHNLLRLSLAIALVLLIAVIAWRLIPKRRDWSEIGVAVGVAFAYWMVWIRMGSWEERTHLLEYGIIAALIHMALVERVRNGGSVRMPAALTVLITALLGLFDEGIQALLPNRVFDVADIFFNALAGFMVVAARLAIRPQLRVGWRVWFLWLMACSYGWGSGVYWGWFIQTDPKMLQTVPDVMLAGYFGIVAGGLTIGVLQWLVIRKHVPKSGLWLLSSITALGLVGIVIFGVGAINDELGWLVGVSMFGTVVGTFQWLILRGSVSTPGWWVLASTIGWVVGLPLGDIVGPPGLGAAFGAITATVLVWLLRTRAINAMSLDA